MLKKALFGRVGAGLAVGVALALVISACGGGASPTATPARPAATPTTQRPPSATPTAAATAVPATPTTAKPALKRGGTFTYYPRPSLYPHLDVHLTGAYALHDYGPGMGFSRLMKSETSSKIDETNPSWVPICDLCESFTIPDPTTYVFKLRSNATWQTLPKGAQWENVAGLAGRRVVAADVKYSYDRIMKEPEAVAKSFFELVKGVEVLDEGTVKITLTKPDADFLLAVGHTWTRIVAPEAVKAGGGNFKNGPLVGSGPWIAVEADQNVKARMIRNPAYYEMAPDGQPYPLMDEIITLKVPDESTAQAIFLGGKADMLGGNAVFWEDASKRVNAKLAKTLNVGSSGTVIWMKADFGPLKDPKVRRAINLAVDRQEHVDKIYRGWAFIGSGVFTPSFDMQLPKAEVMKYYTADLAKAKQLLAEAGFPNGFEMEVSFGNYGGPLSQTPELVVAQLARVGIKGTLKSLTTAQFQEKINGKGEFTFYTGVISPIAPTNAALFSWYRTGGQRNFFNYTDAELDKLIDEQAVQIDTAKRRDLLISIQRRILETDHPFQYIVISTGGHVIQPWVRDYWPEGSGGIGKPDSEHLRLVWMDK